MPYVAVYDIQLYYEAGGQGEALVLLHGGFGGVDPTIQSSWGVLLPVLAARYHTYAVEFRGHGRSGNPSGRLSYRQLADDIAAFIEQLGLAPAHLAGFSLGGEIGLLLGRHRPELLRSLVCVGANYRLDDQVREALSLFDPDLIEREYPDLAAEFARRHDTYQRPGAWRALVGELRRAVEADMAWNEEEVRRVGVPTLLISGENDAFNGMEQALALRRLIPRSELLIVNHAGLDGMDNHRVHATRPEVVGPAILDFLDRQAGTAGDETAAPAVTA